MSPKESMPVDDQRLIACTVYDQQSYYIGTVVKVDRDVNNRLTLLVQGVQSLAESSKFKLVGEAIQHVDVQHKKIYVDLVRYPLSPMQVEALPLWQERLIVNRNRRKVGEISIRKATDVYTVEIPIRSEKLLVEDMQSGAVLAEVALSKTQLTQNNCLDEEAAVTYTDNQVVKGDLTRLQDAISFLEAVSRFPSNSFIKGKVTLLLGQPKSSETITQTFESATTATRVLTSIANTMANQCHDISLEMLVSDSERAEIYRNWLSRYQQSNSKSYSRSPKLPAWSQD